MLFFSKSNRTSFEITKQLVFLFAKNKVKVGTNLVVDENQVAYLMVKDKVTDEFTPGSYTLSVATMPITARALDLHRKSAKNKSIIKSVEADGYLITKEKFLVENKNCFKFVVRDKTFGRVVASINFSCELKVENPLAFLLALRKFVAVVSKNCAEKLLVDFCRDIICEIIQKNNIQINDFMNNQNEVCQNILHSFVEKMQNLGIDVISFNMNKINLAKRMQEAFGNSIKLSPFEENETAAQKPQAQNQASEIVFQRVGMQGEGDRQIDVTVIEQNKKTQTSEVLNIDAFDEVENRPAREFKLNLDFDVASGKESFDEPAVNNLSTQKAEDKFERREDNPNILERKINYFGQGSQRVCQNCGKILNNDDEFCSRCGTRVLK